MPPLAEPVDLFAGLSPVRVVREPRLAERVVIVGGHPGNGKTMMTPIVGSLARVELMKYCYSLEHVCALRRLGRIESDAATVMIRMLMDLDLYNLTMARETNFRFADMSSVFRNPGGWRYLLRLFQTGDATALERITRERPILHLVMHNSLAVSQPLFEALGDRLRILELVRHPLYMIKQWYGYIHRYGTDPRDFTIWFEHEGRALPFFALGWEEQYLRSNLMDRVIYSIERLSLISRQVLDGLTPFQQAQVMLMPFERFVLDPWPYLRQLEQLLDTRVTRATRRELKRQNVPRDMIASGIPRAIYRQCGWQPPDHGSTERQELEKRRQFAAHEASAEGLEVLDRFSEAYEARHLRGIV